MGICGEVLGEVHGAWRNGLGLEGQTDRIVLEARLIFCLIAASFDLIGMEETFRPYFLC